MFLLLKRESAEEQKAVGSNGDTKKIKQIRSFNVCVCVSFFNIECRGYTETRLDERNIYSQITRVAKTVRV